MASSGCGRCLADSMPGSPRATRWSGAHDPSCGHRRRRLRRPRGGPRTGRAPTSRSRSSISAIIIYSSRCCTRSAPRSLATSEIAWPIRHLVRKRKEITTLLGEVTGVDTRQSQRAARRRRHGGLRLAGIGDGSSTCLFRARRVGTACAGPQDVGGRHCDPPADSAVLRARRARDRSRCVAPRC